MRPRAHRARALFSVGAGTVALLLAIAGCGDSGRRAQPQTTRTAPLLSIFEADPQLHADPAGTLNMLRGLGVDTVRVFMPWGSLGSLGSLAPDPASSRRPPGFDGANPADYPAGNWAVYDTILRQAHARGMRVDLTLGPPPPQWAQGPGDPGHPPHPQWRPNLTEFGAFVRAVGTRYRGDYRPPGSSTPLPRVDFWAIWNEPNFGPMIAPQTLQHSRIDVSPSIYRGMLDSAWGSLQATGHGHDTILIGELAPRGISLGNGPGEFGYMVPLRFLRSLYCVDRSLRQLGGAAAVAVGCPPAAAGSAAFTAAHPALFGATGFALHPYPQGAPNVPTPDEPDYADLAVLPRFESTIDRIMEAYGSRTKLPLYSTEFGYETNPPETVFGTVSPQLAAEYLNFSEYLSWRDPRIRSYDQYLLTDPPRANFATGLEFAGGRPKPGYAAYRMPIYLPVRSSRPGQPLEIWGAVRPARYAYARGVKGRARIQFRSAAGTAFRTVELVSLSGRSIYFDALHTFERAGAVRIAWSYPGGRTIYSRTVNISSR